MRLRREKCADCPLATNERACAGQSNLRACALAVPSSPDYRPGFDPVLPVVGVATQVVSFAKAAAVHVVRGGPAPPDVQAARLAICEGCEHFDPEKRRCNLCRCYMPVKTGWAKEECPDKPPRWKAITSDPAANGTASSSPTP